MRDVMRREVNAPISGEAFEELREQRDAPRLALLIRAAKLIAPKGEYLCVVRDASETGLNIRLFHPLPECGRMMLEMQNGDRHELDLVWQEGDRAGLRFVDAVNLARIVECPSRFAKRQIRVNLEVEANVVAGIQSFPARILDISQQGAKIACEHRFSIDQRVKLRACGLPEVNAKVRWRKDETCGLVFEDTFQFGDFARGVAKLQLGELA